MAIRYGSVTDGAHSMAKLRWGPRFNGASRGYPVIRPIKARCKTKVAENAPDRKWRLSAIEIAERSVAFWERRIADLKSKGENTSESVRHLRRFKSKLKVLQRQAKRGKR
jgi:hypothetical protein